MIDGRTKGRATWTEREETVRRTKGLRGSSYACVPSMVDTWDARTQLTRMLLVIAIVLEVINRIFPFSDFSCLSCWQVFVIRSTCLEKFLAYSIAVSVQFLPLYFSWNSELKLLFSTNATENVIRISKRWIYLSAKA